MYKVNKVLKYCKIYVSIFGTQNQEEVLEALKSGSGVVRKAIGNGIRTHSTPEVIFELDNSIEYGAHIQDIINELGIKSNEEE